MASAMTTELIESRSNAEAHVITIIEQKGLLSSLAEELGRAGRELARNPRGFIHDLFADDTRDAKRRRRIYAGLGFAIVFHAILLTVVVIAGWHKVLDQWEEPAEREQVTLLNTPSIYEPKAPGPEGNGAPAAGTRGKGGGGGGQQAPPPANQGVAPRMMPRPPIILPNAVAVPNPTLPVLPNVVGPEMPPPPPDATIGDPTSKATDPSGGPGEGGGMGSGKGSGIGSGTGGGVGPGSGGGSGGGDKGGLPGGTGTGGGGAFDYNQFRNVPNSTPFSWIRRARPITTPEAQANKVSGDVLLRATLNANGTITDIEVINPVPYMTEAAIEALKRCTFRPATVNGQPVTLRRVIIRIPITVE